MGLLQVAATHFRGGNLRRNRQNGNMTAGRIVKTIDQVDASGPTTPHTNSQFPRQRCFGNRCKSLRLLLAHLLPGDRAVVAESVGEAVKGIAWDAIDSLTEASFCTPRMTSAIVDIADNAGR
jgi:hypothetical protein